MCARWKWFIDRLAKASCALLLASATSGASFAQSQTASPAGAAADARPLRAPDVPFGVTPHEAVGQMLQMARIQPGDVLYDLGCGDGRIVVAAAKKYGIKAVGVDIDPVRVKESLENARTNGVSHLVTIIHGDLFEVDFSEASVVTLYLGNEMNVKLMPKLRQLKPGTRILSFDFHMRGAEPAEVARGTRLEEGHEYTIYKWIVPWIEAPKPAP